RAPGASAGPDARALRGRRNSVGPAGRHTLGVRDTRQHAVRHPGICAGQSAASRRAPGNDRGADLLDQPVVGIPPARAARRVERGGALRAEGDWQAGKDTLEQAGSGPTALSGLGEALFWLGDISRALALRERAYVAFRECGDNGSAARIALWLATEHTVVGS